jgi:alanine or glycine:cation symporter, AGCS family
MGWINEIVDKGNSWIWSFYCLIPLLLITGFYFSVRLRFIQIRLFGTGMREAFRRSDEGISSFAAFATGLASRVGTGNIAGVAIAIQLGGPGAVFWMWVTALIGMASAFAESSLAQLFKVRHAEDGSFRGGPAYYIQYGLGSRFFGIIFSLCLISAFGFAFNSVQANSIVAAMQGAYGFDAKWVAVVLVVLTAAIIFGGLRRVVRSAEIMVPVMAIIYLGVALYIVFANISHLPAVIALIIKSAFGFREAAGGIVGAMIAQAMSMGIRRGLFSNEAGMGSAPNAAAVATTKHPASQGLVQMTGVFFDTMVVCSCTAFIVLMSGVGLDPNSKLSGVQLTQAAVNSQIGDWGRHFMAVAIGLFAYSSVVGNYAYAEGNVDFIYKNKIVLFIFRLLVLGMVYFGCVQELKTVWNMADLSMGLMAIVNLIAILLLSRYALRLARDYIGQRAAGKEPVFDLSQHPEMAKKLPKGAWKK